MKIEWESDATYASNMNLCESVFEFLMLFFPFFAKLYNENGWSLHMQSMGF